MAAREKHKGFVQWHKNGQGERIPMVPCKDGGMHRYLNSDTAEMDAKPPRGQLSCPVCGYAYSELREHGGPCWECEWERLMQFVGEFSEASGCQFISAPQRHVMLRMAV